MLYFISARREPVLIAADQIPNSSLMSGLSEQSTTSEFPIDHIWEHCSTGLPFDIPRLSIYPVRHRLPFLYRTSVRRYCPLCRFRCRLNRRGLLTNEFVPASDSLIAALEKYPDSQEPNNAGYNLKNNSILPIYQFFRSEWKDAARGMHYFTRTVSWDLKDLMGSERFKKMLWLERDRKAKPYYSWCRRRLRCSITIPRILDITSAPHWPIFLNQA